MITQIQQPCWEATCDHCGEGDNGDYGSSFHYESEDELLRQLADFDWTIVRAEDGSVRAVYCLSCVDEMSKAMREEMGIPHE